MSTELKLIADLLASAKQKIEEDVDSLNGETFHPLDWWCGHAETTYEAGVDAGRVKYARELLDMIEIDWRTKE